MKGQRTRFLAARAAAGLTELLERSRYATALLLVAAALLVSGVSRLFTARALLGEAALPAQIFYHGVIYQQHGAPVPLPRRAKVGRYRIDPIYAAVGAVQDRVYLFVNDEGELFQPYERLSAPIDR